jgi:uncharacterized protein
MNIIFSSVIGSGQAYTICYNTHPIGHVALYSTAAFPSSEPLADLPENIGAIDVSIKKTTHLDENTLSDIIKKFLEEYVLTKYRYAFTELEYKNTAIISAYEKAGFVIFKRVKEVFWMLAYKKIVRLSLKDSIALEITFRKSFLKEDKLWVFGSRADLHKKGGDIDLYIETYAATINEAADRKGQFVSRLQQTMGDQKIDVVLNMLNFSYPLPIHVVAQTEGVRFV